MRLERREFLQVTAASLMGAAPVGAIQAKGAHKTPGRWMTEPMRWVQSNLRETDTALVSARLVSRLAEYRASCLLIGMGGIVAHYPTRVEHHVVSPHLLPDRDMFGEVLSLAHKNGIRVIGRFDFPNTEKSVFDAHPAWRKASRSWFIRTSIADSGRRRTGALPPYAAAVADSRSQPARARRVIVGRMAGPNPDRARTVPYENGSRCVPCPHPPPPRRRTGTDDGVRVGGYRRGPGDRGIPIWG
jgi:Hypothetical glycosyl hydrolase 6